MSDETGKTPEPAKTETAPATAAQKTEAEIAAGVKDAAADAEKALHDAKTDIEKLPHDQRLQHLEAAGRKLLEDVKMAIVHTETAAEKELQSAELRFQQFVHHLTLHFQKKPK